MRKTQWFTRALVALSLPLSAEAEVPKVAVDITPLHSLVAQVMAGAGEPNLLVRPGASPHGYSLSPSEAEALQEADLVFWIGDDLTPWMEKSLENLASNAQVIEMLDISGTTTYPFREGATFEGHDHGHAGEADGKENHHKEDHHNHGHDHHYEGVDPHAWLDPANARRWLDVIAKALSEEDPQNAALYAGNANEGKRIIDDISLRVEATVDEMGDREFIVFHDAYQYFEKRFGIAAAGAISIGDASDPGPARIREIRERVAELNVQCVFTEPQYNPDMVRTVFEGTGVNTSAVMDPLGADLTPGPTLYPELIRGLAGSLRSCFGLEG
ncbi:zinc ABC transporter substrate-binding protein [Marinobacter sp. M1N3S26]|uniref:zinc ABC transporter substrate-binding protein n=1 Tax=Marinobacter sp. M1N3S26 TaxID=3382299 RepID=UPI00387B46DF